jgi:hypothetical protein
MKTCTKCGIEKPLVEFHANKIQRDGRRPDCRMCCSAAAKEYNKLNAAKVKERKRMAYIRDKEKIMEQHKDYRSRNKETVFLTQQRYRQNNKDKIAKWHAATPRGALNKNLKLALSRRETQNPATVDELMALFKAQDGKCAVSGVTMTWFTGGTKPTSISLDRIDVKDGYSISNIRLVCYQVNCFRNRWSDEDMLAMARAIVSHSDSTSPSLSPRAGEQNEYISEAVAA